MSIRIQRRISLGSGLGLNVSKSGLSLSQRTAFGSIGTTGYSVRTGIPGVFFRKFRSRRRTRDNTFAIVMIALLIAGAVYAGFLFLKALFLFLIHIIIRVFKLLMQGYKNWMLKRDLSLNKDKPGVDFIKFDTEGLPDEMKLKKLIFGKTFVKNGQLVSPELPLVTINSENECVVLYAERAGEVRFFKLSGSRVKNGDYLYRIQER
jgi:hypothetical protein